MPQPTPHQPARRLPVALAVLAVVVAGMVFSHPSSAETDAERERDRVRQERASSAANVNALEADQADVQAALSELNDQLTAEEEALASAQREVEEAEADRRTAEEGISEAEARLAELEDRLRAQMVEAYTATDERSVAILDAHDATDMVKRRAILAGRTADDEDLVDQVRAAQADLRAQRRAAVAAGERAEAQRQEVARRRDSVQAARDQQANFADQVQQRIDAEVAHGLELAERDQALSARIIREAAEYQARLAMLADQQRRRDAAARQQQEQAAAAAAAAPTYDDAGREAEPVAAASSGGSGGSSSGGSSSGGGGGGGVAPIGGGGGGVSLCSAAGITVNCQIASQVSAMVNAAAAAGVSLSGGGYRDPAQQIALRRAHCGSSSYAIYEMPSSQCRPPTAKPGSSQHEVGLAIDFNNCSRSSACFRWLSGNASRFGMYNLPAESWHWSVNGN